jgi:phosphoserine phosphatase
MAQAPRAEVASDLRIGRRRVLRAAGGLAIAPLGPTTWHGRVGAQADPLPSWNAGKPKQAILDFVAAATEQGGGGFVPRAERIATFDQDGTLWVEQPMYTQAVFALARVKAMAPDHPDWTTKDPFAAILAGDEQTMAAFTEQDVAQIVAATHTGMTVADFQTVAAAWVATAKNPHFDRLYTELVYRPMLDVMDYLRGNGFRTYVVSGGGQEFIRSYAERVYGIPPEQVIGSTATTKYGYAEDGTPVLTKEPTLQLNNNDAGKVEDINLIVGRRPVAAFGNSTGDRQMLEWAAAGERAHLSMLVSHDDAKREYAYGPAGGLPDTKVGTLTEALMTEAKAAGWSVVSMKSDWKQIFA